MLPFDMAARRLFALLIAAAVTMGVSAPSIAGANPAAVPPGSGITGEYVGTIGLNGGFSPILDGTGYITFLYDRSGPLTIKMTNGEMSGTWTMTGVGSAEGRVESNGIVGLVYGESVWEGTGTLSGSPGAYRFDATWYVEGSLTLELPFFTSTADQPVTSEWTSPLTRLTVACDQISGRWDEQANSFLDSIGVGATFLNGYFSAVSAPQATQEAVQSLTRDINQWSGDAASGAGSGFTDSVLAAIILLELAQAAAADLVAAGGCEPPCDFMTPLGFAAADFALAAIDRERGSVTSYLVSLLLGAGSMSQCDPALANDVRKRLSEDLELRIENLLADGAELEPRWIDDVVDAARAAQMLGLETFGSSGLPPGDVFVLFGASP